MRRLTLIVSLMLLAGCGSLAPAYTQPAMPVAAAYPTPGPRVGVGAAALDWQGYFTDPQLQTLINSALAHNRDLRIALLRVEEARAAYGIQQSEAFPTLALQASEARSRTPADLNLTRQPLLGSQYQAGVGMASWELDLWGRVRSLKASALENYLASEAAHRAVTLSLIAQVANSYFTLRELDERLALATETVSSRAESLRIFKRRVAVGATSRLNLTQVETLLTQALALASQLEQARATQLNALTLLVGTEPDLPRQGLRLDEQAMLEEIHAGLPSDLLVNRPDIVAAEHQLKAAHAQIGAARAAFLPRIALTSVLGSASAELDGLFQPGSRAWSFSPSLTLPLFDAGRRQANLSLTEVRRDIAVANYERTVQTAFRDVADALAARHWLSEQLAIAQIALSAQTERARLSQLRYDNGASAYLEVLDAQRDLLAAQQQLVQTRRALLSSRVGLYTALGGGSSTSTRASAQP
ncbi:outer membrane factor lipoprotein domain-containing protein [Chitinimonas naiadis]